MTASHAHQAIVWLEQQITEMSALQNANPRDARFREWRQSTVTVLQRIWVGEHERVERFRRVPFTPADPRADARATSEAFRRGWSEAHRVLQALLAEVRERGVATSETHAVANEDTLGEMPTIELPSGAPTPTPAPATEAPRRGGVKARLLELLELAGVTEPVTITSTHEAAPPVSEPVANDDAFPVPAEPAPVDAHETPIDAEAFARATEEMFAHSPVLSARPTAARPRTEPAFRDPDAIALATVADALDSLGVPVERQAEVRARLLDLAAHAERGDLAWGALRAAVWSAMEHPALARRVLPLLTPLLDRAA